MTDAPLRMECYDVSHLSGTNIVASMVVFEDGLPRKDEYRRFNIPESTDDTDSIHRVLTRRLAYLADPEAEPDPIEVVTSDGIVEPAKRRKFSYSPNLLIVDGGQPQVAAAERALRESGVTGIQLCGIAKRLEEIWLPGLRLPGHPAAQQRGAVPVPAHPRRGAPLRDHPPAHEAQARHRLGARRGARSRAGARAGTAAALRLRGQVEARDLRGDRRGVGHRTDPCGGHSRPSRLLSGRGSVGWRTPTPRTKAHSRP